MRWKQASRRVAKMPIDGLVTVATAHRLVEKIHIDYYIFNTYSNAPGTFV